MKIDEIIQDLERKHPNEPEYIQAVTEVLHSVEEIYYQHPEFEKAKIIERMVEPDRILTFRVTWVDDKGEVQTNLGYRVQYNNAIGPYKGGLRFHASVNLSILKFLGFEAEPLYAPIHLSGEDVEVVITHGNGYGESYYSFVNGQYTPQGGTHQAAFREAIAKTIKEFYHKDYDPSDIRTSIIAAISVRVNDPIFESQTKTKLGSKDKEEGVTMRQFVGDFLAVNLDNYLHKHPDAAQTLQKKIVENEKERKAISGVQKKAREAAKKVSLNNKKLRDCKIHYTDKSDLAEDTMIFITEGNSASGSITSSRDPRTQAVFSLRGKPLNCSLFPSFFFKVVR